MTRSTQGYYLFMDVSETMKDTSNVQSTSQTSERSEEKETPGSANTARPAPQAPIGQKGTLKCPRSQNPNFD